MSISKLKQFFSTNCCGNCWHFTGYSCRETSQYVKRHFPACWLHVRKERKI